METPIIGCRDLTADDEKQINDMYKFLNHLATLLHAEIELGVPKEKLIVGRLYKTRGCLEAQFIKKDVYRGQVTYEFLRKDGSRVNLLDDEPVHQAAPSKLDEIIGGGE
jgi:hypothetical protein